MPEAWRNRITGYAEVDPRSLAANPANWRTHPDHQRMALQGVLSEVGWVAEILVNQRTGFVVDGHLRVAAALARSESSVPVRYVDLEPDEERLVLATLDPITALASSDSDKLAALLDGLQPADAAVADLLRELAPPVHKQLNPDDADLTPPDEPITQPGDLWLLGEHRLLCGDAFIAADHERVLDGADVDAVLTDPPYGVGLDYAIDAADDEHLVARVIAETMPLIRRWPVVVITTGHRWLWRYPEPTWLLVWVHPAATGRGPWGFTSVNPALVYGADPYLANGLGSRADSLVLNADREGLEGHPVPKPLAVWEWFLERCSASPEQLVFDPFLGSGTTIIAAEKRGQRCCAIELSPAYCDVAVRRWERVSGRQAVQTHA